MLCVVSLWVWPTPLQTVAGDVGGDFKQLFTRKWNVLNVSGLLILGVG